MISIGWWYTSFGGNQFSCWKKIIVRAISRKVDNSCPQRSSDLKPVNSILKGSLKSQVCINNTLSTCYFTDEIIWISGEVEPQLYPIIIENIKLDICGDTRDCFSFTLNPDLYLVQMLTIFSRLQCSWATKTLGTFLSTSKIFNAEIFTFFSNSLSFIKGLI